MPLSGLYDFIAAMNDEIQEEKIWYMWNHLAFKEEEFHDFRNRIKEQLKPQQVKQAERKKEEQQGIEVSNKILGWGGEEDGIVPPGR